MRNRDKDRAPGSRVLCVVPTLGTRDDWLRICLDSLISQAELVTVVVGPAGSAAEATVNEYGLEYLPFDQPGLAAAVNYGWRKRGTSTEYLTWLGDDDALAPEAISTALASLDDRPQHVAFYGRCRFVRPDGSTLCLTSPGSFSGWWMKFGSDRVPQQGSVFRRSAVVHVGYLDETLRYAMDLDLFLRLRTVGELHYKAVEVGMFRLHPLAISSNRGDNGFEAAMVRHRNISVGIPRVLDWPIRVADRQIGRIVRNIKRPGPTPTRPDGCLYTGGHDAHGNPSDAN